MQFTEPELSVWDDPELRTGSVFASFQDIGDYVSGTVTAIFAYHDEMYGKVVPKIMLDTSEGEISITAGQVRLKAALTEKRPEVGDTLTVKLTDIEKRAGGKTLKHFDVSVVKGGKPAPAAAAPSLTPEQMQAMELLKASGLSA
jgi:hypothetical protein